MSGFKGGEQDEGKPKVGKNTGCADWPLVAIRWLDSSSPRTGWTRLAEWSGVGSLECVSVGFLVAEDGISKTISPHLAYPEDKDACQGNGIIVIPVGAITSIETLVSTSSLSAS